MNTIDIIVQVNGNVCKTLNLPSFVSSKDWESWALEDADVSCRIDKMPLKKIIVSPRDQTVNIVVGEAIQIPDGNECIRTIETNDATIRFQDDRATRDAVFERLIKFYMENDAFNGESIMQNDAPQTDAPSFMADIADELLKFKVTYKDSE